MHNFPGTIVLNAEVSKLEGVSFCLGISIFPVTPDFSRLFWEYC